MNETTTLIMVIALSVGVNGVDAVVEALKALMPQNAIINIVDKVIDYAKIGVGKAEQLYLINESTGDDRKEEATKFVYDSLEFAGIEVTDQVKAIVDGCIEAAVLGLGHSGELLSIDGVLEETYNGE